MKLQIFRELPEAAMTIRQIVFVEEQGFVDEYDENDPIATHLVMFDGCGAPIATCRVFAKANTKDYFLGRLAVMKAHRGQGIGAHMIRAAEDYVRSVGGRAILLHSQSVAEGFYAACGYVSTGQRDEEQGCPHVWMEKIL
ncbi:MAG: GNAT family N-acetyltransferase [Clostridia bacterium]|nr:GNAT family N-acetyltransferase [Clostridia bacterium]